MEKKQLLHSEPPERLIVIHRKEPADAGTNSMRLQKVPVSYAFASLF